jgi:hypothetical protein
VTRPDPSRAGEHDYIYTTDANGHIDSFHADNLQFKTHDGRLPHDPNSPGKQPGDHAGHLAADRFGGSPELDNIVSQLSDVNLSKYKTIENQWAKALKEGKHVSVDVRVTTDPLTGRPSKLNRYGFGAVLLCRENSHHADKVFEASERACGEDGDQPSGRVRLCV